MRTYSDLAELYVKFAGPLAPATASASTTSTLRASADGAPVTSGSRLSDMAPCLVVEETEDTDKSKVTLFMAHGVCRPTEKLTVLISHRVSTPSVQSYWTLHITKHKHAFYKLIRMQFHYRLFFRFFSRKQYIDSVVSWCNYCVEWQLHK